MKKMIAVFSVIVILASFVGCFGDVAAPDEGSSKNGQVSGGDTPEILGVWDGNSYSNEKLGIKFAKPEEWITFNNEQLNSNVGIEDITKLDEIKDDVALIYIMGTQSPIGESVLISYENTKISGKGEISEKDYLEKIKSDYSEISEGFSFSRVDKVTIGEKDYSTMTASKKSGDAVIDQQYCVRKSGDVIICIIATSLLSSKGALISYFVK